MIDYCSSRIEPKEPNDCVFLSSNSNKCCFNPKNTSHCFLESEEENLLCDVDYFYGYMLGEDNYKKYKDKKGYCTFIYGELKGAFIYDLPIEKVLDIKEQNGLEINCLNNQNKIKINKLIFLFIFMIVY